jgi:RNA polymerase sigma-70 factor (ECF subfamily)
MEKLRRRDRAALASFFDRYFDGIFSLAYRLLGDRPQAEDVTQDVFLKIYRGIDRLDPDRDPQPWVTTIVCNACREHWRGRHHKASMRSHSLEDLPDSDARHPSLESTPETDLLRSESERKVQQAVMQLPEALREVVMLRDYHGLSHKEIASALDSTHDAVRKRYSRALAMLSDQLKDVLE